MGEYLLGIDIGTSACKIAVFAKDGTVKATGTGDYQVYYPHPGWAEQNPDVSSHRSVCMQYNCWIEGSYKSLHRLPADFSDTR